MLVAKAGKNSPEVVFSVDNEGKTGIGVISSVQTERLRVTQDKSGEVLSYSPFSSQADWGHYSAGFGTSDHIGGGPQNTGIPINGSAWGRAYLIMVVNSWDSGDATAAALYFVRCGYSGNNFTVFPVAGNTGTFTWTQQDGYLYLNSTYGKLLTWWRLS